MKVAYTQITFATPEARVRYSEASLEVKARAVAGAEMGTLADALDDLSSEIRELDAARAAQDAARVGEGGAS